MPNLLPGSKLLIGRTRSFFILTITIAFYIVKRYVVLQSLKSPGEAKGMTNTIMSDLQTRELGLKQETKPSSVRAIPEGRSSGSGLCLSCGVREYTEGILAMHAILIFRRTLAPHPC